MSSGPDRDTIVGWGFSPTRQLVRFSHLNVPPFKFWIYLEYCPRGEAVYYRPPAPFLYEVASHVKNCHFRRLLLLLYRIYRHVSLWMHLQMESQMVWLPWNWKIVVSIVEVVTDMHSFLSSGTIFFSITNTDYFIFQFVLLLQIKALPCA